MLSDQRYRRIFVFFYDIVIFSLKIKNIDMLTFININKNQIQ